MEECYICFEKESPENKFAIQPCKCKGSLHIHTQCLQTLCEKNNTLVCIVCKTDFAYNFMYAQYVKLYFKNHWSFINDRLLVINVLTNFINIITFKSNTLIPIKLSLLLSSCSFIGEYIYKKIPWPN